MSDTKFCKDCVYCKERWLVENLECYHPALVLYVDQVTGKTMVPDCTDVRKVKCAGRLFERRKSLYEKVIAVFTNRKR